MIMKVLLIHNEQSVDITDWDVLEVADFMKSIEDNGDEVHLKVEN